ncbi:MAG TPA: DUF4136 domain-containing protein [Geminicoccus sp.]|uniref:DUF4136 domain-containing protein n=1 Tax=Geminicoccus sp. TaxID=2024832 RepID=UPI002BE55250|nr:DUF4136 domain-containing protein [Geminicoccus sp.]HWL69949.1 DUF4136 domain-containing protein [Geminicoccus sp.]
MAVPSVVRAALLVLVLAGCATSPTIRSDYDTSADFAAYHSFGFAEKLGTDSTGYASLLTQRLKEAVSREMAARGYEYTGEKPDLLVNFQARLEDKVRVYPAPAAWGPWPRGYYGYRGGFYDPWFGYAGGSEVVNYTEGTLNIDLIDRERRQMVWEGVAVGEVDADEGVPSQAKIDAAVKDIFAKYPFRAGSTAAAVPAS